MQVFRTFFRWIRSLLLQFFGQSKSSLEEDGGAAEVAPPAMEEKGFPMPNDKSDDGYVQVDESAILDTEESRVEEVEPIEEEIEEDLVDEPNSHNRSKYKTKKENSRPKSREIPSSLPEEPEIVAPQSLDNQSPTPTSLSQSGDIVNITAYSPEQIIRGETFLLSVFAHLYEQREEVTAMAQEMDPENRRQGGKTLNTKIERGEKLIIRLTIEDWELLDPVQELIWFGQPASVEFEIDVPPNDEKSKAIGTLIISNANGPVGRMHFNISVTGAREESVRSSVFAETVTQTYTKAYLSYAAGDQNIVDQHKQRLKQNGITEFFNIKEEGADWEDQVLLALRESDLFMLFWSEAAHRSDEVDVEWQTALGLRYGGEERLPDFVPIPIGDSWPDPPYELAFLNFKHQATQSSMTSSPIEGDIIALKSRCEQLISDGNVEVFEVMRIYYQANDDISNELYALENKWNTAKRKERLQLWSEDQLAMTKRQITFAVLGLIGEMT